MESTGRVKQGSGDRFSCERKQPRGRRQQRRSRDQDVHARCEPNTGVGCREAGDRDLHTWMLGVVQVYLTEGFQPDVCGAGRWVVSGGIFWLWPLEKLRSNQSKKSRRGEGETSLLQPAMYGVRVAAGKNPCLDREE